MAPCAPRRTSLRGRGVFSVRLLQGLRRAVVAIRGCSRRVVREPRCCRNCHRAQSERSTIFTVAPPDGAVLSRRAAGSPRGQARVAVVRDLRKGDASEVAWLDGEADEFVAHARHLGPPPGRTHRPRRYALRSTSVLGPDALLVLTCPLSSSSSSCPLFLGPASVLRPPPPSSVRPATSSVLSKVSTRFPVRPARLWR